MTTSLHQAATTQHQLQPFIDAFRAGEDLDARNDAGETPLHCALRAGMRTGAQPTPAYTLLALGAAADLPDRDGVRPMQLAIAGKWADIQALLRALGATGASAAPPLDASRPLVEAVHNDPALSAYLLRHGADPDQSDGGGETPLHACGSTAITAALLARGADPNRANQRGEVPLHLTCRSLQRDTLLLLHNGADPRIRDARGRLPVQGLREQSYADDFYDGWRLEQVRATLIAALAAAAGA